MIENGDALGNGLIAERVHTWEIIDFAESQKARNEMLLRLATMPALPETPAEREFLGAEVWQKLIDGFTWEAKLSEAGLALLHSAPKCIPQGDHATLLRHRNALDIQRAFDFYLVGQFAQWGSRLTVSPQVANRALQWEIHDTHLMKRYTESLLNRARAVQREGGAHLEVRGEELRTIFRVLPPELHTLFRKVHTDFGKRESECTNTGLALFFEKEIVSGSYVNLSAHLADFQAFIGSRESKPRRFVMVRFTLKASSTCCLS